MISISILINMVKGKKSLANTKVAVHYFIWGGSDVTAVDQNSLILSFVEKYTLDYTAQNPLSSLYFRPY